MSCLDPYGRKLEYVRLSVTDRCNLRCFYCLPERHRGFAAPAHYLSFDEIERVMRAFAELGVSRVRLTGGEPLVRRGIEDLAARLKAIPGIDDLSLSTNALLLEDKAPALRKAGIGRLNVSLDSLRPERFRDITHGGELASTLAGLAAAKAVGFAPIKINMLVMKGINDDEVNDIVDYCLDRGFTLRFIETMPVGPGGREAYAHYLGLDEVREQLAQRFELIPGVMPGGGPARYVRIAGSDLHIGFITPLSQHFCATCNRLRLAADGTLHLCLGNSHNFALRSSLRAGIGDEELRTLLIEALALKPRQHNFSEAPDKVDRVMSATGG
jgi:cyclic pyranopterin phosphate synthase